MVEARSLRVATGICASLYQSPVSQRAMRDVDVSRERIRGSDIASTRTSRYVNVSKIQNSLEVARAILVFHRAVYSDATVKPSNGHGEREAYILEQHCNGGICGPSSSQGVSLSREHERMFEKLVLGGVAVGSADCGRAR
jgi:hypothetical protein